MRSRRPSNATFAASSRTERGRTVTPVGGALRLYAWRMESVTLAKKRTFGEALKKVPLFQSDRMLFDLYCLQPGQSQVVHRHEEADKVYVVLEGEALFQVGDDHELLPEGSAVIARAGEAHGVRNESTSNVVLLVAMAPRPV